MSDIARALYAAYNAHDLDAVRALYVDDATHTEISNGQVKRGSEAIASGLQRFFEWFPDATWISDGAIVDTDGDVAVPYAMTATLQADMGPILGLHQPVSIRGVHILRVSEGRITSSEDYWDTATFRRQITESTKENQ